MLKRNTNSNGILVPHSSANATIMTLLGDYVLFCRPFSGSTSLMFHKMVYKSNSLVSLELIEILNVDYEIVAIEALLCQISKFTIIALTKTGWKELSVIAYVSSHSKEAYSDESETIHFQLTTQLESSRSSAPIHCSWSRNGAEYAIAFADGGILIHSYLQNRDTAHFYPYGQLGENTKIRDFTNDNEDDNDNNVFWKQFVSLSPDGSRFSTICPSLGRATLWRTSDMSEIVELSPKRASPSASPLCLVKDNCTACLGQFARIEGIAYSYTFVVVYSAKPRALVTKRTSYLTTWEASKAPYHIKRISCIPAGQYSALAVSAEGRYAAVGDLHGSVSLYILFSLQQLYSFTNNSMSSLNDGGRIKCIEFISPRVLEDHNNDVEFLSFSSNNSLVQFHAVPTRQSVSLIFVVFVFLAGFCLIFYILSYLGI